MILCIVSAVCLRLLRYIIASADCSALVSSHIALAERGSILSRSCFRFPEKESFTCNSCKSLGVYADCLARPELVVNFRYVLLRKFE